MFEKEKKHTAPKEEAATPSSHMSVMPELFYGGHNPTIYAPKTGTQPEEKKAVLPQKKSVTPPVPKTPAATAAGPGRTFPKWLLYTGAGVLLLAIIGGVSWYYITEPQRTAARLAAERQAQSPAQEVVVPEIPEPVATTIEEGGVVEEPGTLPEEIEAPLVSATEIIEFPRFIFANSPDSDADSLTDLEEEVFGTNPDEWDTDQDQYYDGQELVNLYNPNGLAPIRIIDSGLVREYINPVWQYRVYYPMNWQQAGVDPNSSQVLFSAATGDFIEIRSVEKRVGEEEFVDWFAAHADGQQFTDLTPIRNRFEEEGYTRSDDLVAYFDTDRVVYVLVYHPGNASAIPFRHIMQMMTASFRPTKTLVEIPEQAVVPVPGATSTISGTTTTTVTSTEEIDSQQ